MVLGKQGKYGVTSGNVLRVLGDSFGGVSDCFVFAMLRHVCRGPRCVAVAILRCSADSIQIRLFSNADANVQNGVHVVGCIQFRFRMWVAHVCCIVPANI